MEKLLTPQLLGAILGFPVENIQPKSDLVHYCESNRSMTHINYSDLREKAEDWLLNNGMTAVMVGKQPFSSKYICVINDTTSEEILNGDATRGSLTFTDNTKIHAVLNAVDYVIIMSEK